MRCGKPTENDDERLNETKKLKEQLDSNDNEKRREEKRREVK